MKSSISDLENDVLSLRTAAALTQHELAERTGIAQPNIAAYETGRRRPSPVTIARIQEAVRPRPSAVLAEHRDAVHDVVRRHHGLRVRVFGSIARDEDRIDSDVDLLVRFDDRASLFDQFALTEELEALLGSRVDVVSEGGLRPGFDPIREEAIEI